MEDVDWLVKKIAALRVFAVFVDDIHLSITVRGIDLFFQSGRVERCTVLDEELSAFVGFETHKRVEHVRPLPEEDQLFLNVIGLILGVISPSMSQK